MNIKVKFASMIMGFLGKCYRVPSSEITKMQCLMAKIDQGDKSAKKEAKNLARKYYK